MNLILMVFPQQMSTLNALSLNNTRRAENQIVVFNRVPKVGSQTFMELLRRLAIRNNFKFHRDSVQRVETIRLAPYQQEELAEMVSDLPTPSGNIDWVLCLWKSLTKSKWCRTFTFSSRHEETSKYVNGPCPTLKLNYRVCSRVTQNY